MNPTSYTFGLFTAIPVFVVIFWILAFACLIQLFRFLTKGIRALDIYLDSKNRKTRNGALTDDRGNNED